MIDEYGSLHLQAASRSILLDSEQLAAAQAIQDCYLRQIGAIYADRANQMQVLQASAAGSIALVPELSEPHQAARMLTSTGQISDGFALQRETYMQLIRSFVLCVLTPFQAGLLCAASYPYLIEFPSVLGHVLAHARASLPSSPFKMSTQP